MADFASGTPSLPASVVAVAAYVDGSSIGNNYRVLAQQYPNLIHVGITAELTPIASLPPGPYFGDAEPGNGTVAQWVAWAAGATSERKATLYCGLDTWYPTLYAELGDSVDYIVANYVNYTPTALPNGLPASVVGWQYTDTGGYDLSLVQSVWLGSGPVPSPAPPDPAPEVISDMQMSAAYASPIASGAVDSFGVDRTTGKAYHWVSDVSWSTDDLPGAWLGIVDTADSGWSLSGGVHTLKMVGIGTDGRQYYVYWTSTDTKWVGPVLLG